MIKNRKGITLISLIVTIIILLILSGLTVTLIFGNNAILNKAKYAKQVSANAQEETGKGLNNIYNEIEEKTNSTEPKQLVNKEYTYTGSVQTFTVPYSGTYKLEVWGAQGGNSTNGIGGKGGYSTGTVHLNINTTLYIYVGGKGSTTSFGKILSGGYNGGGTANDWGSTANQGSGGGSTDIRLVSGACNYATGLNSRLIVAGGGGGAGGYTRANVNGGFGGGTSGGDGMDWSTSEAGGNGGTQIAAGTRRGSNDTANDGGFGFGGYTTGTVNAGRRWRLVWRSVWI